MGEGLRGAEMTSGAASLRPPAAPSVDRRDAGVVKQAIAAMGTIAKSSQQICQIVSVIDEFA